jgi:hypothetical protein
LPSKYRLGTPCSKRKAEADKPFGIFEAPKGGRKQKQQQQQQKMCILPTSWAH